jgi:uncharacterized membrane protein
MISLNRSSLALIGFAFCFYHGLLGIFSLSEYQNQTSVLISIALYFLTLFLLMFDRRGIRMHRLSAIVALITVVAVSQLVYASLDQVKEGSYTTWHIVALSALLGVVAIRQYPAIAWAGFFLLAYQLLAVSQAAYWAIVSSAKEAVEFQIRAVEIDSAVAVASAAHLTKMQRLQETLNTALPLLEKIQSQHGELSAEDKREATLLEAELRDQIRGRSLLSSEVVNATRAARARGVEVQLLDDGGLDDLSSTERERYLTEISERLAKVSAGKVVIRASQGDGWRVTMAAIQKDSDRPDLFIRL